MPVLAAHLVLTDQGEHHCSVVKSYSVYPLLGGLLHGDSGNSGEVDFGGIR